MHLESKTKDHKRAGNVLDKLIFKSNTFDFKLIISTRENHFWSLLVAHHLRNDDSENKAEKF